MVTAKSDNASTYLKGKGMRSGADIVALRLAQHSLEQAGQNAPRADLVEPIKAGCQQSANGMFPKHWLNHLTNQQIADLLRFGMRQGIDIRPYRQTRRLQLYPRQCFRQSSLRGLHEFGMEGTGDRQSNGLRSCFAGKSFDGRACGSSSRDHGVARAKEVGNLQHISVPGRLAKPLDLVPVGSKNTQHG